MEHFRSIQCQTLFDLWFLIALCIYKPRLYATAPGRRTPIDDEHSSISRWCVPLQYTDTHTHTYCSSSHTHYVRQRRRRNTNTSTRQIVPGRYTLFTWEEVDEQNRKKKRKRKSFHSRKNERDPLKFSFPPCSLPLTATICTCYGGRQFTFQHLNIHATLSAPTRCWTFRLFRPRQCRPLLKKIEK